jgi:prenyltransferase beta subunit
MLQVARLAANPLRDAADLVAQFVHSQHLPDGGFANKAGESDLYYTVFGIDCLVALRRDVPADRIAAYLEKFGDGDALDLVHLTCLARCWSAIGGASHVNRLRPIVMRRLGEKPRESVYDCFLATGAAQDVGADPPDAGEIDAALNPLAIGDGSYSNDADIRMGNTPATAAAITLQHQLGLAIDERSVAWLLARHHAEGGFFAIDGAPMPDLLSTAVALHALSAARADLTAVREACLDYIDTLWTNRGSFYGNWAEDSLDVEYTWYGLLALGHLSL